MGLKWILAAFCLLLAAELALSQNVGDYIIPTSGGNGNGEACVFPFLYRNQTYTNCTMDRHTKLWCAVTSNYDVDPQWGNCNYTAAYFYTEPASTSTASTPESTGCTVSFDKQENTFAFGGNPVTGVDNEDECKQQCQGDDACLGLDFNTNTNMCYHFSDERVNDGQEGEGTNHYIKVPCTSTAMPSTTVSTTAGDGSCVDTFTEFTNRWIQGGVEQQGVTTKEDCESECLNNENCYAYEFTSRNLCYHHNDPDVVGQDLNVGSNDVNHYVRIRCAPSTTTGSTDSSPTSPTPTECEDSYERLQRTWARGGQQQTNIETSAECIDLCTANPNCTALDFNPTSNIKCYLFLHDIPTPIPDDSSPVTHFVRQRCGEDTTTPTGTASTTVTGTTEDICVFVYEVLNSTAFFGGTEQVDASNLGLCQDACNNDENCVSFDYNHGVTVSGPRCYLHLDGTGQQYISNTTYHYIKTPCPDTASTTPHDGCTDTFEIFENFFSYGGVRVSGLNTKEKCEAECLSHPIDECLGFDFTASLECFIHNDTSKFEDGRNMVDNTEVEVTQYIRKECATPGTSTGTGPTPCLDIFERTEKTQSFGGTDQPDVDGIEACKTRCLEIEDCLGFDYNVAGSGTKCFTYTDEAKFEETFSADSIDRYTRMPDPACITTTTGGPPDGCKDTFTETENTFAYDGIDLPDDRTIDDCKETCRGVETCVGINYSPDSAGTRCYWFNDTAVFNRDQTGEGVSKYTRVSCKTTVTDTTLPPTGPTCNNVWTPFENQGDFGATEVPGANTLAKCQQNCIDDPDCKSIEVTNTNQCFKYSRDVNLQPRANITSYKLDRCVSSPGPTQPCLDEYIAIPNTHAPGGTKSDQETPTAEDCQRVCSTTEGCKAVDFTPSKECWLHFRETNVTGFFQGATHYILFRECDGATTLKPTPGTDPTRITGPTTEPTPDCVPTWEERRDVNSFDGVEEPTAFTREACQSACAKNPECVALDYNNGSPIPCYLHLDIGNLDTTQELIGNVQYVLIDRCPQVTETTVEQCQPEWLETKDVHVLGGQDANPPANTEDMCKQRCIDEPTCVAIDFDTRNLKCFIMSTTGSFRTAAGTNHYDLQQRCTTSGSTVTLPGGCQDQFTVSVNRHLNGGEEVEGSTVEICKQACSRDPECTSVDFNRLNNECYVHTISNPNLQVADGIDNYVIERCTSTTATPNPCPDTFEQFANQHSRGGTNQADSVDTLQKCKDECSSQANCLALDFVKTGGNAPCWLHFSSGYMNTRASNNDIDQYVITRCSETTTTSTTTTTTATTQAAPVAGCPVAYYRHANSNAGSPVQGPLSSGECRAHCQNIDGCYSADWSIENRICYVHREQRERRFNTCCDRYETRCGGCTPHYYKVENQYGPNGQVQSGISTEQGCKDRCDSMSTCQAFYRTRASGECYTLMAADTVIPADGFDYYSKVSCINYEQTTVSTTTLSTITPKPVDCIANLVFIVDSSGSIGEVEQLFETIKNFIANSLNNIVVGSGATRVALIDYNSHAEIQFDFDDYDSRADMQAAIRSMSLRGGRTNTTGALRLARTELLRTSRGWRSNVQTVFVLLNDGENTVESQQRLTEEANALRQVNRLTVIGIGLNLNNIAMNQLTQLVTPGHLFLINDFNNQLPLWRHIEYVVDGTCSATSPSSTSTSTSTTTTTTTTTETPVPQCPGDVVFVIDSSGSIRDTNVGNEDNWQTVLNFMIEIVQQLKINEGDIRVGAVKFGNEARVEFRLDSYTTKQSIINAINNIEYLGENTNTTGGIIVARDNVFNSGGDRSNVDDTMILITDGFTTRWADRLQDEANTAKNQNINIFGVGVTNKVNTEELMGVVSGNTEEEKRNNYVMVDDFGALTTVVNRIVSITCR